MRVVAPLIAADGRRCARRPRRSNRRLRAEISMTGVRRHGGNIYNLLLRDIAAKTPAQERMR